MSAAPITERLIARLPQGERITVLDEAVRRCEGRVVDVEWSGFRKLDEARHLVGTLVAHAYAPGGSTSTMLIVQPADPTKRAVALSAAHVLRISNTIRWAPDAEPGSALHNTYRVRGVVAGPPRS